MLTLLVEWPTLKLRNKPAKNRSAVLRVAWSKLAYPMIQMAVIYDRATMPASRVAIRVGASEMPMPGPRHGRAQRQALIAELHGKPGNVRGLASGSMSGIMPPA